MKRSAGERAWAVLGVAVVVYEIAAPEEQLLSEAVDRFLVHHPVATRLIIVGLAAHLLNLIPNKYDPLHHTALLIRKTNIEVRYGKSQLGERPRGGRGEHQAGRDIGLSAADA